MRALVISDTHVKRKEDAERLHDIINPYLEGVDIIIHAGDSVSKYLVDLLENLKPTYIVSGNMDSYDLVRDLPEKLVFNFGKFRIGLTHGWGQATGLSERVFRFFEKDRVDAIIFGHSHRPFMEIRAGILLLNPGSPTDTRFTDRNTMAILRANDELKAEFIELKH